MRFWPNTQADESMVARIRTEESTGGRHCGCWDRGNRRGVDGGGERDEVQECGADTELLDHGQVRRTIRSERKMHMATQGSWKRLNKVRFLAGSLGFDKSRPQTFGTHTRRAPAQKKTAGRGLGRTLLAGSTIVGSREPVQKILRSTLLHSRWLRPRAACHGLSFATTVFYFDDLGLPFLGGGRDEGPRWFGGEHSPALHRALTGLVVPLITTRDCRDCW